MHFEMGIKEQIHELYDGLLAYKELFRWLLAPYGVLNNNLIKNPEKYRAAERLKIIFKHIKIERFYNVRIDYVANRVDHTVLGGKLDLKENIEETFRILA
ncbi:MAG: DUF4974 domain-containing protein, partial [Tannerellaceae bacterium]|nr:DUF4974 domain-containing protein [Tannerellaceae bacterium]